MPIDDRVGIEVALLKQIVELPFHSTHSLSIILLIFIF